jgi:hypothetical protein
MKEKEERGKGERERERGREGGRDSAWERGEHIHVYLLVLWYK